MKYLKGKKTKVINALYEAQDIESDHGIDLMLHKGGDLDDIIKARWFKGKYIDLDILEAQVSSLVKQGFEWIELRYPSIGGEWDEMTLYMKDGYIIKS